jgi:TonB-linked SusC/RagA family outer membrane protein
MKKIQFLILLISFFSFNLKAQEYTVAGKVFDQKTGEPIPGVSTVVKESSFGIVTDLSGAFRLQTDADAALVFSCIGYKQQVVIVKGHHDQMRVFLEEDVIELAEIIITGAQAIDRPSRELGAGAQIVNRELLNQGRVVNPLLGLNSKVAGLRVNVFDSKVDPAVMITLRGTRSLQRTSGIDGRNPNAPLYVVDGVPIPDIGRLNPNDIESITVLKGANAAALYGSEGVNGALMITTKKGNRGKGVISFSNTTTFSNVYLLPEAQTQYGQGVNGIYSPVTFESWGPEFDGTMRDFGLPLPDGTQPQLLYAAPSGDNRLNLFQTGVNMQNDISFSGGDEKSTYFLSAQYVMQTGVIPKDENERFGLRFNGSRNFGRLKTSYNINYIKNDKNITPDGPWIAAYRYPANFDYDMVKDWQDSKSPGNPNNYFIPNGSWLRNPYFQIDNIRNQSTQQILNGKVELEYKIADWVSALYRVGMYSMNEESRNTVGKFEAQGTRNTNGSVNDASTNYQRLNSDFILSFNKEFGDISTRLLLGQNLRTDYKKSQNVGTNNLLYADVFNPGSRVGELNGGVTITEQRAAAVYGEWMLGYKNYLFFTFTGRNDWTSVLSASNRSYFYPGVSASFIASDAFNFKNAFPAISYLKIYSSWNRTGNVTLTPYQLNNAYSQTDGFPFGNTVGFLPSLTNPNPNIKPEFVSSYEVGMQWAFFKNRLNVEGAYVFSDSDGQIFNAPVSRATGYNSANINSGRLTNDIVELTLSGDVIRTSQVRWNLGFNFAHNKTIVRELYGETKYRQNFRQSFAILGEQFPSLWVSDYKREQQGSLSGASTEETPIYVNDKQGRVVIDPATGNPIIASDNVVLGTLVPPYLMGLGSQLIVKDFTFGLQFDARLGGWMYSEIVPAMYEFGTHPITAAYNREALIWPNSVIEVSPGVYEENTSIYTSGGGKEFWTAQGSVQSNTAAKSDFFKLRELNVTYHLPADLLARQNAFTEVSVAFVATNLFIVRDKDNDLGDPEYLYNNTDGYSSFRQVPPVRTYGFNLNLQF